MSYEEYFGDEVDIEAVTYLQLANDMLRSIKPDVITIAEGNFPRYIHLNKESVDSIPNRGQWLCYFVPTTGRGWNWFRF
mgnify:CR=1 FL=1